MVASVDKKLVVPYRILKLTGPTKDKAPAPKLYKHYGPFKVDHLSDYPKDLLTDVVSIRLLFTEYVPNVFPLDRVFKTLTPLFRWRFASIVIRR